MITTNIQAPLNADTVITLSDVPPFSSAVAAIKQGSAVVQVESPTGVQQRGQGEVVVRFPQALVAALLEPGAAEWDILITDSGGSITRFTSGTVAVVAGSAAISEG